MRTSFETAYNKPFEYLRGLVFSGEASNQDMAQLRDAIREGLPSRFHSKILNSIDPRYIGAIGAAYQARIFVRIPRKLVQSGDKHLDWPSNPPRHDEL